MKDTLFEAPIFDEALIRKYDVAGPRYTSYPTAPHFHDGFGEAEQAEAIREAEAGRKERGVSLYFHLPFCKRVCYFCACNVTFIGDRQRGWTYNDLLRSEMDKVLSFMGEAPLVKQLHWGGGSPSFNPPDVLADLAASIRERFPYAPNAEVSVEVDPRETSREHLEAMARHGFNRVSLGIQDFDLAVQKAVNRVQPYEKTQETIDTARALGYDSVNVDLIYGLPRQSKATFENTIERTLELQPDRIALFNFAYLPEMVRHQRVMKPEELPRPSEKLAILRMAVEKFTAAGYVFIGMDHFARPDDELAVALRTRTLYRNFQGYTTHAGLDLYAFGVTSISQVGPTYSQNAKEIDAWGDKITGGHLATVKGVRLTADDLLRRDAIYALMCHFLIEKKEIEQKHGILFDSTFAFELETLRAMEADGLVRLQPERIEVLPAGRFLVRNIAMVFDAHLRAGGPRRYSRTV